MVSPFSPGWETTSSWGATEIPASFNMAETSIELLLCTEIRFFSRMVWLYRGIPHTVRSTNITKTPTGRIIRNNFLCVPYYPLLSQKKYTHFHWETKPFLSSVVGLPLTQRRKYAIFCLLKALMKTYALCKIPREEPIFGERALYPCKAAHHF